MLITLFYVWAMPIACFTLKKSFYQFKTKILQPPTSLNMPVIYVYRMNLQFQQIFSESLTASLLGRKGQKKKRIEIKFKR